MLQFTRAGLAAALLLAASTLAGAQTAEKPNLAWKLDKGSKHTYALDWNLELGQSVQPGGAAQKMEMGAIQIQVGYTLEQEVTEVTDGVATVKATFKTIKATVGMNAMGMPGPQETYDSEQEGGSQFLVALGEAIGESVTFKMSTLGKVSEVSGGKAISDKITKVLEEALTKQGGQPSPMGMGPGQTAAMTLLAFEDGAIESALNMLNHVLPGEAGQETWNIDHAQKTKIGTMKFTGKYRFGEQAAGKTKINFKNKGDVSLEGGNAADGPGLTQMIKDLDVVASKVKGLATFGDGHIVDSEVEFMADAEGTAPEQLKKRLEMMMGGANGGDMKMGVKYTLKLRYERQGSAQKSDF